MTVLAVLKDPDPRLREVATPVEQVTTEVQRLVDDMFETMQTTGTGIGIAAPQVGVSLRIFVLNVASQKLTFINPVIVERRGEIDSQEGCLSLPYRTFQIKRAVGVRVKAIDRNGKSFERHASGLEAMAIQHENDHLNGVLMTDKGIDVTKHLPPRVWKSSSAKRRRLSTA